MSPRRFPRPMLHLDPSFLPDPSAHADQRLLEAGASLEEMIEGLKTRLDGVQRLAFEEKMRQLDAARPRTGAGQRPIGLPTASVRDRSRLS